MSRVAKYKSKKYPNLYRHPRYAGWYFRKYFAPKRKQFFFQTRETDEAKAYRAGLQAFEAWAKKNDRSRAVTLFRDIARDVLESKEGGKHNTYRTSRNQIERHLIPAFGHLQPSQITRLKWEKWIAEERRRHGGIKKFFNAHKALMEILRRSLEEGFIDRLPELENPDETEETGRYLTDAEVEGLITHASEDTALLIQIMWRMGPRPGELIQWEFAMIDWRDGKYGSIDIPGRITKTGRARKIPLNSKVSELLRARQKGTSSRFIFPSEKNRGKPIREYKTGFEGACRRVVCAKLCGAKTKIRGGLTCKKLCHADPFPAIPYDLRHTFISNQARKGRPIIDVARYCDTSAKMIEKIYAKSLKDSMLEIAG